MGCLLQGSSREVKSEEAEEEEEEGGEVKLRLAAVSVLAGIWLFVFGATDLSYSGTTEAFATAPHAAYSDVARHENGGRSCPDYCGRASGTAVKKRRKLKWRIS